MSEPTRPTAHRVELINAHEHPPRPGSRVLALQHGGVLVPTEVKSDFLLYFDAWAPYPKVPASVKKIQLARLGVWHGY
jgi:hypothetical protein